MSEASFIEGDPNASKKDYESYRAILFYKPESVTHTEEKLLTTLKRRVDFIRNEIASSHLKRATDMNGLTLEAQLEFTEKAILELDGKREGKYNLEKVAKLMADEQEKTAQQSTKKFPSATNIGLSEKGKLAYKLEDIRERNDRILNDFKKGKAGFLHFVDSLKK